MGNTVAPTAGVDGTGGGGGGGGYGATCANGAKGGDGVVIVRIAASLAGGLDRPKDVVVEYDGNPHTSYATTVFYTVTGDNVGTDIGTYVAVVTPAPGIEWTDGTSDAVTVVMTIKAAETIDGEVDITGATVGFFGATSTNWVYNADTGDYDLLLKFTGAGGFTLPGTTKARILAVGGGGGGGGAVRTATANQPYGGGGGGGAGGFVETNGLFGSGSYAVSVGAGGAGGLGKTTHTATSDYSGTDGGDTSILLGGASFVSAFGGGAGGGETDGHSGGSGGGGSMFRESKTSGIQHAGGSGKEGQGHAGGVGNAYNYGGGGGGAGGAGAPASDSGGGVGGAGAESDITGETAWYAGGGGGGCNNKDITTPAGGILGGGGDTDKGCYGAGAGAVGNTVAPTAGVDGTGGGGGGGGYGATCANGAKGGDGIVYVRISMSMNGSLEKPPETLDFTYDGNAHTSMVSTAFFDVEGLNIGTTAGVYVATATLKPGCTWLDGSSDDATVTMTINPVDITLKTLVQPGWTYNDAVTPDPVCEYEVADPSAVITLVYEYADSETATEWSAAKPIDAGTYWVRVRTADEVNYRATPKTLKSSFEVEKVSVTFSNLRIRDWLYGTPEASTPSPKCDVSPDWVEKVYEYADAEDAAEWSHDKPTAAGTHWVRVRAPDEKNYAYTPEKTSFKIVKGLGSIFTDYVEIKVAGWTGTTPYSELTNFPYKVTLTERTSDGLTAHPAGSLVGFLYERAGMSGDDLAFTDDDGNVLCFYMKEWDTTGDSTVYVKIPKIASESQTIRFYWHVREGQAAPEHDPGAIWSDWTEEARDAVAQPSHAFGLVYKDGVWVNYFTQLPEMDKYSWNSGETPGKLTAPAVLADGGAVISNIVDSLGKTYPSMPTTEPGTYRIIFEPNDPDGEYEPLTCNIDFSILGTLPVGDLSGGITGDMALTLNGRVMLANDDDDAVAGHKVLGQAYWRTREVDIGGGKTLTNDVFWTHEGTYSYTEVTLLQGTSHQLNAISEDGSTNVLWWFTDVLIGNGYSLSSGSLSMIQCALPHSATGLGNSTYANRDVQGDKKESGNIILRNIINAAVYSPCYTNGVGTIYFDALNNYRINGAGIAENYRIVVEIAKKTDDNNDPTDENAGWDGGRNEFANITTWTPYAMLPLKRDGTPDFVAQPMTNDLALAIETGRTSENFYRVCVPVNCREPVRFRIRRASKYEDRGDDGDAGGLILLDNILVSYPAASASMAPYGHYDNSRSGKQVLGQEAAMANVPFPAVSDAGNLLARGDLTTYVGAATNANEAMFVQSATMHYRWRYLEQRFDPEDGWKSVALSPFDNYKAAEPLDIPAEPGDIEFWYELKTMMPYYEYHDYSGQGVGLGGLYTEEKTAVTNRMDTTGYSGLPSGGKDWFVRLREGASNWEDMSVVLTGAYGANQPMELVGEHTWRGLVKVPAEGASGQVSFSFHGVNRQTAGDDSFKGNEEWWYPKADVEKLPARGEASISGSPCSYAADGASGYMEFTFNDESLTFSIGHAESQNFNAWDDARRYDGKFVGTYAEESGVTTSTKIETNANMSVWRLLQTENSNWNEAFKLSNYLDPGYPKGVFLSTHKMPGQWNGDNGMFVDAALTKSNRNEMVKNSGIAWQMQGESFGDISFTQSDGPSGLDTISFKARLAQSIGFDDFSVWWGDGASYTNNYAVIVPALLSYAHKDNNNCDYGPGASMSVVGYYQMKVGCYEVRIERNSTDGLQLSIYKWYAKKSRIVSELLTTHWFSGATFWNNSGASQPNMYGVLLSLGEDEAGKTTIIAGLTRSADKPSATYLGTSYNLVCYQDDGTKFGKPHTKGTYGVLAANCNGQFLYPRQRDGRLPKSTVAGSATAPLAEFYANKTVNAFGTYGTLAPADCRRRLLDAWAYTPGRNECFTNTAYGMSPSALGIRALSGLKQTVDVYLKPRGESSDAAWSLVKQVDVSGYGFSPKSVVVRTNESCHVMLKTGEDPVDVTVHDIKQTGWNGEDIPNIGNLADNFVYTQARVIDEEVGAGHTNRHAMLQPARAVASKALSIRSPVLKGLGMVSFEYNSVKEGCEVWLQAATNAVSGNLSGTLGYNFSTNAVALGEQEPVGSWITLKKFTYEELKDKSSQMYSCGWHTHKDNPLVGVFRVVVAPSVVAASQSHAMAEPEWGSITITKFTVRDEPAIDETSWIGWNLRTLGDGGDSERRMFLSDLGSGLSAGLNNSTTADIAGDPSEYDKMNPTIQSPTFRPYETEGGTVQATIGQVRFRARLYETNTALPVKAAKVSLYGVMDGSSEDWGTALTNFTVDSHVYRIFEYKASSSLKGFASVRFVVDGVTNTPPADVQRVLLDEVVVSERVAASVGFEYARPFRTGLNVDKEITNILSQDQQPLAEESWGVQTKLKFDKYDQEIDTNRGFRVYFRYYKGDSPWGYDRWGGASGASAWARLVQVGDAGDYVFRSTAADPATIVPPTAEANTAVQYMLYVEYFLKGVLEPQKAMIELGVEGNGWTNPLWYEPIDYNADPLHGNGAHFSPYTILDSVSPGRVWINEVNYCDGPKAQTGGVKCETNQFIEIAVPWGVDLRGWRLVLTDMNHKSLTIAELGKNGVPSSKKSGNRSADYDFLVLQSPKTRDAGGIKDSETGLPAADGTWVSSSLSSTFKEGSLQYDEPYQLELFRPSGILEHQFVVAGTNEWRTPPAYYWAFGYQYDGTNLLNELNAADPSAKRFYAGEDLARKASNEAVWSSLGVSGGAHGEDGGWTSEMKFTPGRLNEGQDELSNWYIKPNGASIWVYAQSLSGHVRQRIGDDTSQDTFFIVNSGASTNISYTIDPWYAIGALTVNGETNAPATGATKSFELALNNITQTTEVVVSEGIDPRLLAADLDPAGRYTPAILNWLAARYAAGTLANPDGPITLGKVKELHENAPEKEMPLTMMYWFDLDPTEPGWWWRFGFTGIRGEEIRRKRVWSATSTEHLTNHLVTVKLYLSNDVSQIVYAPNRLQGVGNEQSDSFGGSWTSVTFKVKVMLNNGLPHNAGFLPFRWFTFMPGSFDAAFESKIEILDPFARSSAGYSYGWYGNSCNSLLYRFSLDDSLGTGANVESLKADSTYDGPPFEDDN